MTIQELESNDADMKNTASAPEDPERKLRAVRHGEAGQTSAWAHIQIPTSVISPQASVLNFGLKFSSAD